ncbi:MAG: hypothetical protein HY289_12110 [Planctomycetes bacterium]|nr:hypothetical protein [Planctomycetota bacterium]
MFTLITCPTCQHKFTVPEAAMGKRHSCPHCQSLFLAGKSVAEAEVPMKQSAPAEMPMNKTLLGETEPPIKYNCPRCKKPLESPAIEAGTKKPCPHCGGRLQIPNAPPPSAPQPNINKTLLASDEAAPAASTGFKAQPSVPMSAPQPPLSVPSSHAGVEQRSTAAPSAVPRMLMFGGLAAFGLIVLVLLSCIAFAVIRGPKTDDAALQAALAAQKQAQVDLEKYRLEIAAKQGDLEKQQKSEADMKAQFQRILDEQKARQEKLDRDREFDLKNAQLDQIAREKRKTEHDAEQKRIEDERKLRQMEFAQMQQKLDAQMEATRKALESANRQAATTTTIIQAPPPMPPPHHWYHPRYYYPW